MAVMQCWELAPLEDSTNLADWDEGVALDQVTCPIHPGHIRAGRRIGELRVVLPARSKTHDVMWTWGSGCLLNDRVISLFKNAKVSGYELRPVAARWGPPGQGEVPRFWELVVTGWAGVATPDSGVKIVEKCSGCGHTVYSGVSSALSLFDNRNWDGSDLFIVWPLPLRRLATTRVRDLLVEHRVTGMRLVPGEALRTGTLTPGRLSYFMPDARARELGIPLGIY